MKQRGLTYEQEGKKRKQREFVKFVDRSTQGVVKVSWLQYTDNELALRRLNVFLDFHDLDVYDWILDLDRRLTKEETDREFEPCSQERPVDYETIEGGLELPIPLDKDEVIKNLADHGVGYYFA